MQVQTFACGPSMSALWDRSVKADGTAIESVVHVTLPGNELMREIHNGGSNPYRMPAILHKEDHEAWLTGTIDEARAMSSIAHQTWNPCSVHEVIMPPCRKP
jgi:putative SOS response-associated peptidase YedK